MLKEIIIDDEENGRLALKRKLENYCPEVEIVAEASSAETGMDAVDQHNPDIVFLDVEMPKLTGFDMLERLTPFTFHVIFTTAHDQYAIEAIRSNAFDYLLKPVDIEELKRAVSKISRLREPKTTEPSGTQLPKPGVLKAFNRIAIPTMEGRLFLDTATILHIEAQNNYTIFHFTDQPRMTVSRTLKEIEDILPADQFFRVHHSHIINLNFIRKYVKGNGGYIELQDGKMVDVSRRKKDEFLKLIGY
jgi:two-component system, LytTR family, response regulator